MWLMVWLGEYDVRYRVCEMMIAYIRTYHTRVRYDGDVPQIAYAFLFGDTTIAWLTRVLPPFCVLSIREPMSLSRSDVDLVEIEK